jgi:signal transduction histidine kinase
VGGLQIKLIAPFLILTLATAIVVVFIISVLMVDSEQERFINSMLDASRVANDSIVQQEQAQLERLRFLVFADGIAQAMYDKDSQQINDLMRPIIANVDIDLIAAIDQSGHDIVTFGKTPDSELFYTQEGVLFSGMTSVQQVLRGAQDDLGDKYVEIVNLEQGPILFTAAPVQDSEQKLAGAMLVGSYLDNLLLEIKKQSLADVLLVDMQGNQISTTLEGKEEGLEELIGLVKTLNPLEKTKTMDASLNQRPYQVAYSPLIVRKQQIGWVGVIKTSDYLVSPAAQSRQLLIFLFAFGTGLVILVGYWLAQNIARPILGLRSMSQAVAAGDLNQSIGLRRNDEIGELGEAFDTMTLHLRERTEEAQRLYQETLQRNKELAEINARLEAAQLQLIQSEKLAAIGQLTAGIVHDVKNPFAVIMGMAEVLAEEESLDETTLHGLKVIRESAVKGNTIVSDLLKFARQSNPEMRSADLRETVKAAMRLTAYLTRRYNTITELPEEELIVTYDVQLIEQVLINMIHNAVQSMPNGGDLKIRLECVDDVASIAIQDSGCGISQEDVKRVFDPFFTTKPEGEGTGLGLSVSYGIVANHNGQIHVQSKIGEGTTFTILLPVYQPSSTPGEGIE